MKNNDGFDERMTPEASGEELNYWWIAEYTVHLYEPQGDQKVKIENVKDIPTPEEVKDILVEYRRDLKGRRHLIVVDRIYKQMDEEKMGLK